MTAVWRKVTLEQRHQLIQILLHMGREEAHEACVAAGVSKNYAEQQAREISVYPKKVFGGGTA